MQMPRGFKLDDLTTWKQDTADLTGVAYGGSEPLGTSLIGIGSRPIEPLLGGFIEDDRKKKPRRDPLPRGFFRIRVRGSAVKAVEASALR